MQTVILHSDSKSNLKLLLQIAKKLDINAKVLTEQDIEDIGLANAIKSGETGQHIDIDKYLEKLSK